MGTDLEDLSCEVQQEVRDLEDALNDHEKLQSLLELKGDEAQRKLDLLQHVSAFVLFFLHTRSNLDSS